MAFDLPPDQLRLLAVIGVGVSMTLIVVLLFWPVLARRRIDERIRQIGNPQTGPRLPVQRPSVAQRPASMLSSQPRELLQIVAQRLSLAERARDDKLTRRLAQAGFRGQGPVVAFLAARLLAPIVFFTVSFFYIVGVLQLSLPLLADLMIALLIGGFGFYIPGLVVTNRRLNRYKSIKRVWPEALDLLLICVESGMTIEAGFRKVAQELADKSRDLAVELSILTAELTYLQDRKTAYENLSNRIDLDTVRATVTSLIQSENYGTPVGQTLRVLSRENRDMRIADAEKLAASLPPKLTVPMILFFLPVLFAVIITPAVIQIMGLS